MTGSALLLDKERPDAAVPLIRAGRDQADASNSPHVRLKLSVSALLAGLL